MSSSSTGKLFVLAGPSGAGKTTLAHHLVDTFEEAVFSVSATTRCSRGSERNGVDYFFMTEEEFRAELAAGHFLEHAEVHGHLYGTRRQWVADQLHAGRSVILDIDVQGALQVKEAFPWSVLIFILPPDPEVLAGRLKTRNTDDPETVASRMAAAARETGWIGSFDYFVRNDELETSMKRVESIYSSRLLELDGMAFPPEAMKLSPERFRGLEFWKGRRVIVTSGPTREPVDDVRFLSNRSSGLMGRSLAQAFRDAGADVLCVSGPACFPPPPGVETVMVGSADEMLLALDGRIGKAELLVMAAAVADFAPSSRFPGKMERNAPLDLKLNPTPDILGTLRGTSPGMCPVLAFALEFGPGGRERAMRKLKRKGAAAIFLNPGDREGYGMEGPANLGELLFADGSSLSVEPASKRYIAHILAAAMGEYLAGNGEE
ncbi:MAG: guanylate kinase [Candidatus Aegiribacteria sp.]